MVKKKNKRESKDYDNLKPSSQKRLASFLEKAHKSGYRFAELRKLDDNDFALALDISKGKRIKGNKWSNVESNRRLLNQVQKTEKRRTESIEKALKPYKNFGFKGKGLEKIKRELIEISGNIFSAIANEIEKTYFNQEKTKEIGKRKAEKYTKKLMLIPKDKRDKLNQIDQDILDNLYP